MKIKQRMRNRSTMNNKIHTGTNNALKCSKNKAETVSHRITKFWLSNFCWERGLDFATEAVFKNNSRCDFMVKDWMVGIEVLGSEGVQNYIKKNYPIPTIPIPSTMSVEDIWGMLTDLETSDGENWNYYRKRNMLTMIELKKARPIIRSMAEMIQ